MRKDMKKCKCKYCRLGKQPDGNPCPHCYGTGEFTEPPLPLVATATMKEVRTWLNTLWVQCKHTYPSWDTPYWWTESRKLTEADWHALEAWLADHQSQIVCEPHNACMGFGFGITLSEILSFDAPGVPAKEQLELLGTITNKHLPETMDGERGFELGWRLLSPWSHNPINTELLKKYDLESPRDKANYDY